jgi:4-amino-4-deoxy-L-arabinose transferase-like glycosyltransferase
MFVTLFENDSAQFAVMAMRMVQENDFLSLFKGPEEYLDKPHMHFWLAALSFKVFGLYDWAYRIPAILATFLGAYSCYGLGRLLYNTHVGKLAALVFMTSQTIVLSVIDVRTDAVLTGFTIFAIWQLAVYIEKNSLGHMILGAFGAGIAFSTKGQIALLVIGLPLLCHLAYTRKWKALLHWKVLMGLLFFGIAITPMLYAYYNQFDLHPEKIIRGKANRSGIFFIFWEQSFERLSGEGVGKNSSDYFFFFHTFLWVFLPWTVLGLTAFWCRVKTFFKLGFKYNPKYEFLTLGGISLIFLIISFAQFKLPHYLNIIIPLFSVLTASYLYSLYQYTRRKPLKILLGIQYFLISVVFIASTLIRYFVFKVENPYDHIWTILLGGFIIYYVLKREEYYYRLITISIFSAILLNITLNIHFYPSLLEYQAGSSMAKRVEENKVPKEKIYKLSSNHTWALDFYNQVPLKIASFNELRKKKDFWLYVNDTEIQELHKLGFDWDRQFTEKQFRITRLQAKFLNPNTRKKVLNKMHLIHVY